MGQLGSNYGAQAGLYNNQMQQYLGNLGQNQYEFNVGAYGTANPGDNQQTLAQQQMNLSNFGTLNPTSGQTTLGAQNQQFGQNMSLAQLYNQGVLGSNPFANGNNPTGVGQTSPFGQVGNAQTGVSNQNNPFGSLVTQQQQYETSPEYQYAQQLGYENPTQMAYAAQFDPTWFKDNAFNKGVYGTNMQGGVAR
jgi:hypothetical protein